MRAAVHVYLEHHGRPWRGPGRPSPDPTPRAPVRLELAGRNPGCALYLGRPCYGGFATHPACGPLRWTHRRYSRAVVGAMAVGLRRLLPPKLPRSSGLSASPGPARSSGPAPLGWLDYSGGALAVLLAPHFPGSRAVLTFAANLDLGAWSPLPVRVVERR